MAGDSAPRTIEGLAIREAEATDLKEVYEIEAVSFGDEAYDPILLHLYLSLTRETFLVATLNGVVVGYTIGVLNKWGEGHVISLATHPNFRRKGIASALLSALLRKMKERGAKSVRLEVKVSNEPAINLYTKFGFKTVGVIRSYYPSGEDAYLMVRDL